MKSIIPGLIDDLGRECLIRLPYQHLPTAISVSQSWESEIRSSKFRQLRSSAGVTRPVLVLAQVKSGDDADSTSGQGVKQHATRPAHRLTVYDPVEGSWAELPGIPDLPEGLPVFSGIVGVGSDLVVIGGWDPVSFRASSDVFVYSFLSGQWRKGSDMPGVKRSFFGYASDHDRTVLVAGGHDEDKNALRSALLYDVAEDKWIALDDMARERDECKVVFRRGSFHVISGYLTASQGCFEGSVEVFDLATLQWGAMYDGFLDGPSPSSCVVSPNGTIYACMGRANGDVAVRQDDRWQTVAEVPADVRSSQWVVSYEDKIVVFGCFKMGDPHQGYTLDLKTHKWNKINMPVEFCGHVQSGVLMSL